MKRLLAVLLAVMMLATLTVPALADAEPVIVEEPAADGGVIASGVYDDLIAWSVTDDGVLTLTAVSDIADWDAQGYWWGCDWNEYGSRVRTIVVSEGVNGIGDGAFAGFGRVTRVELPDSLRRIGVEAFSECSALTEITIPRNVTRIDPGAFNFCAELTGILVAPGNSAYRSVDGVLYTADGRELHTFPNGKHAVSFEVPDGVVRIGKYAFHGCEELQSVYLPDSVREIDFFAFEGCTSLTDIRFPPVLDSARAFAFTGTPWRDAQPDMVVQGGVLIEYKGSAVDVTIPDGVTCVCYKAIGGKVRSVVIPASVTRLEDWAIGGSSLREVTYYTPYADGLDRLIGDTENPALRAAKKNIILIDPPAATPAPTPAATPAPDAKAEVKLAADAKTAQAKNFEGLYARVALVLDNNGVSGLYVTQATINADGNIVIPSFMVPGLAVKGVNIALVPTIADIGKPAPDVRAMDFRTL